jgi:hypothetical protein
MRYVVCTSQAKMPQSCWGKYRRVAVIETTDGIVPKMISERARGVVRIVETWERLHVGGDRSAYAVAMREAADLADRLNAEVSQ